MPNFVGQILANRYSVEEFIGRGGMAEVYKVWDRARATFLALKVLRDDLAHDVVFVRRFQREARSLEKLQHPNIVRFYGLEQDDLLTFIVMDHVEGSNLRAEIYRHRQGGIPPDEVVKYMQGICSALHYAHHSGIIHCDLKSGNVLIDEKGKPLVTDFGIARMTDTATTTLVGVGTPAYMAPEQILGRDPTPQSDIYSLGITLYEMLTGGERPFTGEQAKIKGSNSEKVRWEQIYLPPPSPRAWNKEITPEVEAVVMKCLSKEPGGRYESALALLNDLKRAMMGMGVEAMPGQIERNTKKQLRRRKRRWRYATLIGSVILVIVGLLWSLFFEDVGRQALSSLVFSSTPTPTATITPSSTPTVTASATPSLTASITPSATPTATASQTLTLTTSNTPTHTPTATATASATLTPTLSPGSVRMSPGDEALQSYLPGGNFKMGSENGFSDERPLHPVYLDPFWIDQTEVTNEMFARFIEETGYITLAESAGSSWVSTADRGVSKLTGADWLHPNGRSGGPMTGMGDHPVVQVSWQDAEAYCQWAGKRLPTEAEWEFAARGGLLNARFPWGDANPVCQVASESGANFTDENLCDPGGTDSVGSYPPNGYGLLDMAGNAWEWVSDWYGEAYYQASEPDNPTGPDEGRYRVARGGSWDRGESYLSVSYRHKFVPGFASNSTGFRCVSDFGEE